MMTKIEKQQLAKIGKTARPVVNSDRARTSNTKTKSTDNQKNGATTSHTQIN